VAAPVEPDLREGGPLYSGDIIAASSSIVAPYSPDPLRLVISSVVADQNNNGKVAWSSANQGGHAGGRLIL
jgi:hypothetical protein